MMEKQTQFKNKFKKTCARTVLHAPCLARFLPDCHAGYSSVKYPQMSVELRKFTHLSRSRFLKPTGDNRQHTQSNRQHTKQKRQLATLFNAPPLLTSAEQLVAVIHPNILTVHHIPKI